MNLRQATLKLLTIIIVWSLKLLAKVWFLINTGHGAMEELDGVQVKMSIHLLLISQIMFQWGMKML